MPRNSLYVEPFGPLKVAHRGPTASRTSGEGAPRDAASPQAANTGSKPSAEMWSNRRAPRYRIKEDYAIETGVNASTHPARLVKIRMVAQACYRSLRSVGKRQAAITRRARKVGSEFEEGIRSFCLDYCPWRAGRRADDERAKRDGNGSHAVLRGQLVLHGRPGRKTG